MINDIITKHKKCPECGTTRRPTSNPVFHCASCGHEAVSAPNYWVLKEDCRDESSVEDLKKKFNLEEVDDLSAGLTKIRKAVENFEEEGSEH